MKQHDEQVFGRAPTTYLQFRPALSSFPMLINLSGESTIGNGSGYGHHGIKGCYGEYIERYHFYNEVNSSKIAALTDIYDNNTLKASLDFIQQIKKTNDSPLNHYFEWTHVKNIFTNQLTYLPTVMISMAHTDSLDRNFIPFIDSCGQSSHVTFNKAFQSALNEFIERQALVGAWLSKNAKLKINLKPHPSLCEVNNIINLLIKNGELYTFDLGNHLPGYSVIIFYFSKSKKDYVQYSVGMASDGDPKIALIKAVHELWQSYIFIYLNADNPEDLDPRYLYLNELIKFNTHDTKNNIPFIKQDITSVDCDQYLHSPNQNLSQQIDKLKNISDNIYIYDKSEIYLGQKYHFCKVLSIDFYIHMGITLPLNLKNKYSSLLMIDNNNPIKQPIPFP